MFHVETSTKTLLDWTRSLGHEKVRLREVLTTRSWLTIRLNEEVGALTTVPSSRSSTSAFTHTSSSSAAAQHSAMLLPR